MVVIKDCSEFDQTNLHVDEFELVYLAEQNDMSEVLLGIVLASTMDTNSTILQGRHPVKGVLGN